MNGCIFLLVASLGLADVAPEDRKSFQLNPQTGKFEQVQQAPAVQSAQTDAAREPFGDPQLALIADRLKRSQFGAARDDVVAWLQQNAGSPAYDSGLYLAAQAFRGADERIKAFYYCDQLLDEHGDSSLYQDTLQLQYDIADEYLNGKRDKALGFRWVGRHDEAVDMLFRIQQRSPGSPVAERALLRTADYYWANGDFDLAGDAYHAYIQSYPRSPLVPQARMMEAKANLAQYRGPNFDSTTLINAQALMRQIASEYPDLAREEGIAEKLEVAERQLARKLYLNAEFYKRTGKKASAIHLCKRLLRMYPSTPEAEDARQLLAQLDPSSVSESQQEPG